MPSIYNYSSLQVYAAQRQVRNIRIAQKEDSQSLQARCSAYSFSACFFSFEAVRLRQVGAYSSFEYYSFSLAVVSISFSSLYLSSGQVSESAFTGYGQAQNHVRPRPVAHVVEAQPVVAPHVLVGRRVPQEEVSSSRVHTDSAKPSRVVQDDGIRVYPVEPRQVAKAVDTSVELPSMDQTKLQNAAKVVADRLKALFGRNTTVQSPRKPATDDGIRVYGSDITTPVVTAKAKETENSIPAMDQDGLNKGARLAAEALKNMFNVAPVSSATQRVTKPQSTYLKDLTVANQARQSQQRSIAG